MPLNALNAAEDEPLSSLQSSQSDVEDTEGRSPKIPIMYKEVVISSDAEEVEEYLTEQKSSRKHVTPLSTLKLNLNNNENNNETPARKQFIPQSCKSLNRRNRWAHSDFSEDDDSDYDPDKDIGTRLTPPNLGFSSDSNTDSDDHSEGPAKKKMKKKSDEAYANQMKSVLHLLDDDKAKEEYSIKISKDLFGSNKNRKRPSPRNQDEEENQKSDDEDEDSKSKKKQPRKTYATDLVNVYQIEVVPKSSGKDESHNKLHMCTLCTDTNFTNFAKHLIDMHPEEDEVQVIKQHPKKSKKRSEMISMLKARGNHDINMKTIKAEEGMFVPNRRVSPGTRWKVSDYSPCPSLCSKLVHRITKVISNNAPNLSFIFQTYGTIYQFC